MRWQWRRSIIQRSDDNLNENGRISKHRIWLLIVTGMLLSVLGYFILGKIPFIVSMNDLLLDQIIFYTRSIHASREVVVIAIDDESAAKLGEPIPRNHYVRLMRKLSAFGARTIAFDLLFRDLRDAESDSRLASVTDSLQHVIHCFTFSDVASDAGYPTNPDYEKYTVKIKNEDDLNMIQAWDATFPNHTFIHQFDRAGFVATEWDSDGRLRRMPLVIEFNGRFYPSFGLAVILDYLGVSDPAIVIKKSFWGSQALIETASQTIQIPINNKGQVLLNFYGRFKEFDPLSFSQALDLLIGLPENLRTSLPTFQGKIVLIGSTETGIDKHPTPFAVDFPGVGFHATFINNILQKNLISEPPVLANVILSASLTLLLLAAFIYYYHLSRSMRSFLLFSIGLMITFNVIAYFLLFVTLKIWFQLVPINGMYVFIFFSLVFFEKVIHLKELKDKILQLENNIFLKITAIDKLDQKITSQTEQYRLIQYFASELHKILTDPAIRDQVQIENFFPRFFENQEIIKSRLIEEIEQLKSEKNQLQKDHEKLEFEKTLYEKFFKGEQNHAPVTPAGAEIKPAPVDRQKIARAAMAALQSFQSLQRKGLLKSCFNYGIVASIKVPDETGQMVPSAMGVIFDNIKLIGGFDSTVLITGEHGTGKERVAWAIHEQSKRADKPMVVLNCAAIPENLLESELFGHVRGAFTGAISDHKGAFESADGGTIFMDEIGELKPDLQAKLLRVLQEKEIQRLGSNKTIHVDIRVITATNKDLAQCIETNNFRSDLYFRLNVVNINLPPLRERRADIPLLIQHFLDEFNNKYNKKKYLTGDAILAAICYDWPGNIRMLQHLVEKVCVMNKTDVITLEVLPSEIQAAYRNIFSSEEVPWWNQIQQAVLHEQEQLLEVCKQAIRSEQDQDFLNSAQLIAFQQPSGNCYEYFTQYVNNIASIFPVEQREALVRATIVQMQEHLFQWCREEKVAKLGVLYDKIELILGRTRRQIDNWRKTVDDEWNGNGNK